ncbi:hypothetical protein CsSME_00040811 [Camellia sinensis var. sinensis]
MEGQVFLLMLLAEALVKLSSFWGFPGKGEKTGIDSLRLLAKIVLDYNLHILTLRYLAKFQQTIVLSALFQNRLISPRIHIDIYKTRKSAADEKIISYNDVVLRRSDLDILSGPYFLNDRIIEFYFSYLPSCYPSEEILLVSPSIAFWIANGPDIESLKDFVEPLNLSSKKLVIFPVNNNDDVTEAEGGNCWSLLVFERNANVSVHHDSYGGLNAGHAKQLYRADRVIFGKNWAEL